MVFEADVLNLTVSGSNPHCLKSNPILKLLINKTNIDKNYVWTQACLIK